MNEIKTIEDIAIIAHKIVGANLIIPQNMELCITLSKEEYKNIVPEEFWSIGINEVEYNAIPGVSFKLITHFKYDEI